MDDVPAAIRSEVADAAARAVAAGAAGWALTYVGAGAEGIIFEDGSGRAFKVGRHNTRRSLFLEAEALSALQNSDVRRFVPEFFAYDDAHNVIVRELLEGRPGRWADDRILRGPYDAVAQALNAADFGPPEWKENSWIITLEGPKLVDLGFVHARRKRAGRYLKLAFANLPSTLTEMELLDLSFEIGNTFTEGGISLREAQGFMDELERRVGAARMMPIRRDFDWRVQSRGVAGVPMDQRTCLYHVTYLGNLRSIAREGLRPNRGGGTNFAPSYAFHTKGRTFLTEHSGVFYWYGKLEDHAEHNHENVLEAEAIPVVLAVTGPITVEEDPIGSRDALHAAYITTEVIPPEQISVWTNDDWYALDDDAIDLVDPLDAVRIEEEAPDEDDEYGEPVELVYFRDLYHDNVLANVEPLCAD